MATSGGVVGSRCYCEGYYGTVRFVGLVPPTNGEWMGVEWDNTSRGKHDGTKDGVQYFHCNKSGTCASFVRPKKLSFGLTYKQSIEMKYGQAYKEVDIVFGGDDGAMGKRVEMYGFDEQAELLRQFSSLVTVELRGSMLCSAGPNGEVTAMTPNVTALDLSGSSLLSSWKEVADITRQLPLLKELLLSENKLTPSDSVSINTAFNSITILYINRMDLDWDEFSYILSIMPSLDELHACENNISSLGTKDSLDQMTCFPESLKLLNLEENNLSDWQDILQLQHLPHLHSLVLSDNKLSSVGGLDKDSFSCLTTLSLNGNNISKWSEIDNLNVLKTLENLRFKANPVHQEEQSFFNRQLTIACLPSLKVVNNSPVSLNEKQDSERYYIKKYINEWLTAEERGTTREFILLHPLYPCHIKVHGLPSDAVDNRHTNQSSTAALRNRLIAITISCPDSPNLPVLKKKLPDSMTVQKLKGLLQRLYKINTSDQILSYKSHKMSDSKMEIEMNDGLKLLSFYSIESDDCIFLRTSST